MRLLYRFLKSVRLAIAVILLITALSVLSTLVPQGRESKFYQARYSPALYSLITALSFNRYFSSALFIVPVTILALNLGVCAVDRVVRRMRTRAQKRFGPDIVHIALLVLIAGGLVTTLGRHEEDFVMAQGQETEVTPRYRIKLLSFEYLKYDDGSPKAWISIVDVLHDGVLEARAFPIRVNHPLRLKGISVYQATWENQSTFLFRDTTGAETIAHIGEGFEDADSVWYLADVVEDGGSQKALLQQYRRNVLVSIRKLAVAESLGQYTLVNVKQKVVTGLRAVSDPGFTTVIVGAALLALGLLLTFAQNSSKQIA
jgi:cytochrome c biogenesis protein ResB